MNVQTLTQFFGHIPGDWFILGIFGVLVMVATLRFGTAYAVTFSLAFPLTALFFADSAQTALIGSIVKQFGSPLAQAALVGVIFVLLFLVLYRIISSFDSSSGGFPLQAVAAAFAAVAVAAVFWAELAPLQALWHFGPQVQHIFGETYRLWWLLGAYVALAAVRS